MSEKAVVKEENRIKIKKPRMYKVIMHNDDYTTMEFVIKVLTEVFNKDAIEATKIMYDVHKKGIGIAGVYTYDIAKTKLNQAMDMAEKSGFPFKLSMEEE
ncbi:ATP-dependent Clp protease adapter protein ClpS [Clostridium pasteurianum DSM 525 = ATCC 6013]|uniref:ATP-dependent Clp protease adapter protein ClpS n=1 Tax=Clostridium pasteurianum DSM 525 = ATCC 6013 TaxID=1262449 RepID=A0A0H3JAQ9_CLOPA|nr:ATP-dependent Clp protease adaptor ClpS [Clostridium pasteurianum]AJA48780.1 ATP-dependent Clp protease adapter protein ClpS [Clostridium pasteurianum DSM 525 = ATCC 6013]AJA52768.1 ATP-dependent Clp protease adapter protein ClpS [Clostridium pasteurianum DSM 525 = ATCC 6013]AOZ76001.1 ATP-dependent Clp protease adaptor ClpS [Clostridium pasteurianum DSM 525 = ATCC 6013]AOZ79797.1 ATP-dependent Clp protease adaptor ClpS [Clostridium pasteurianum]ELP60078.1 ATP-dependent protease adaptor pro